MRILLFQLNEIAKSTDFITYLNQSFTILPVIVLVA